MSDKELVALGLSALLPPLIALILQPTWSDKVRSLVSFAIVALYTLVGVLFTNQAGTLAGWQDYVRLGLGALVVTATTHEAIWKQTGASQWVESRSSPPSAANDRLKQEVRDKATPPRDTGD